MYLIFILFVSYAVSEANSQSIDKVLQYFKSESLEKFKTEWNNYRKPFENTIASTLKETVGLPGMNIYIRKKQESLCEGYYHSDNQIKLILRDVYLRSPPRCWLPEVQFSLTSNVLKIETTLSDMIVFGEYSLVRNKSDIIYDLEKQDVSSASPFLFQQVQDTGTLAVSFNGCLLTGFIIATLNGQSVNLGYQHFKLTECLYTVEIFREGDDVPPVIAKYNPQSVDSGMSLNQLILRQLDDELLPKLQGTMFSFINTSSVFGENLRGYIEDQERVFKITSKYLREVIRNLNKITIQMNRGAVKMQDYKLLWYNGKKLNKNWTEHKYVGEQITLSEMVLTGLDTMYSAHTGGPYKMNYVLVAEEIRFSSLQVRGYLHLKSNWKDLHSFSCMISDMAVDVQLDILPGRASQKKETAEPPKYRLRYLEVTNYRAISFSVSPLMFGSAEALVKGYLLDAMPKMLKAHLQETLPLALRPSKEQLSEEQQNEVYDSNNLDKESDVDTDDNIISGDEYKTADDTENDDGENWYEDEDKGQMKVVKRLSNDKRKKTLKKSKKLSKRARLTRVKNMTKLKTKH